MNMPAFDMASMSGEGITPSKTVSVAVAASAMVVKAEGIATVAVFSVGAEKNMTTITRT